jgi:hypothetical protein
VKAPNLTATDNGKPCGKMLYDLSRAWADHGFPVDDVGNVLPMDRWGGGKDPAQESAYREHYLHVPFAHPNDGWEKDPLDDAFERVYCPLGGLGTRVWVRETWAGHFIWTGQPASEIPDDNHSCIFYRADGEDPDAGIGGCIATQRQRCWRPATQMPRWASRLTLEVVGVRVVRVQEITPEDAKVSGVEDYAVANKLANHNASYGYWTTAFARWWESKYGKRWPWAANCWCWVVAYNVVSRERTDHHGQQRTPDRPHSHRRGDPRGRHPG